MDFVPTVDDLIRLVDEIHRWVDSDIPHPYGDILLGAATVGMALIPVALGWGMFLKRVVMPIRTMLRRG